MKKITILLALVSVFAADLRAQSRIINDIITENGDHVVVAFEVETDDNSIPRNRKEVLIPYLYNGKDTLFLDPLEVYGKNRFKRERQEYHIAGEKDWELGNNQIMKGEAYCYTAQTHIKRWMKPAQLGIRRYMVGCACENELEDQTLGQYLFEEPQLPPRRIISPAIAPATRIWEIGPEQEIIFKVARTEMDPKVFNNEVVFARILEAVDKIYSNPEFKVEKIQVAGYASPEGGQKFNTWLGENRANALIDYIIKKRPQYGLTAEHFEKVNGEENWEGLKKLVLESDMKEKDAVAALIDDQTLTGEQRKSKIKAMDGGRVWRKMLYDIYPHLRSARYLAVYYNSEDDMAVEVINAANEMLRNGQVAEGYELAMTESDDMRSYNTIGAALALQGRYEEALTWFEKAVEVYPKEAKSNMEAIKAELEFERQQAAAHEEYMKKFE